ncbi:vacuolar-sorting protein SNF8-like [Tubulanus polymorphus]|uniref:vacuolar-sorting protein SNF8-like n=1 Tax=Tubulanus polymorphus TaxID=672921 RepID=UPI003DA56B7E
MRRRGVGLGAVKNKHLAQAKFKDKGSEIAADQVNQMSKQLDAFRENLEEFASKHKQDIRKDADFRVQFQEMCASIGVDPLASGKGFWAEMLGVGDFYYELGVQVIEVCLATSHRHGGLMDIDDLKMTLMKSRGKKAQEISSDDITRAVSKLKVLGNGFTILPIGPKVFVQSVPGELSMDHTQVLQLAQETGRVSVATVKEKLDWEHERAHRTLDYMVSEGLSWVDDQDKEGRQFWFPGFFHEASNNS